MIIVYPDPSNLSTDPRYLRPTPLISISQNTIRNKIAKIGSTYDITLNGAIVTGRRSAIVDDLDFPEQIPEDGPFPLAEKLPEIIYRQNQLREWFTTNNHVYIEVLDVNGDQPRLGFFAKVQSVNFEEGIWVDICRYSVNLTADYLIDRRGGVLGDGVPLASGMCPTQPVPSSARDEIINILNEQGGGLIEDFNDTWSIETDEANGQYINGKFVPRSYRVTRNMTSTGRDVFPRVQEPWACAREFIKRYVDPSGLSDTTSQGLSISEVVASGLLGIPTGYRGYNHVRSENFDRSAGSYSVSDTWLLASGDNALENYNLSVSTSIDSPFVTISIDGNIKGLSDLHASGYTSSDPNNIVSPYDNAYKKYNEISATGAFGISSDVFRRANNAVAQQLNSQPNSITLGLNETAGEITYNLEFNNRPTNYFTGVLSESINVNDTYPGDVFAIIPVIGRPTGPILNYIGGRTEYKRDVNIEIKVDHTDLGYNNDRASLMLTKPSVNEPIRSQLNNLIDDLSPRNEPGIRKYFISAPAESWSPKEGIYSLSLSWTYELDR
jgi:hypothetical protein